MAISFPFFAQRGIKYPVRTDPRNPGRSIIELPKTERKLPQVLSTRNVLDATGYRQNAIAFQPFEMKNPRTGKALDPNATLTIQLPDGTKRTTTVKIFFEQVNEMEKALALRGKSLRNPAAFSNLKPNFDIKPYQIQPKLPEGFNTIKFEQKKPAPATPSPQLPGNITLNKQALPNAKFTLIDWAPELYISEDGRNSNNAEFPTIWTHSSLTLKGPSFPLLVRVPKAFAPLIAKIVWQVADKPFDGTLKTENPAGILASGTVATAEWYSLSNSTLSLPNPNDFLQNIIVASPSNLGVPSKTTAKALYFRVLAYDQTGQLLKIAPAVVASFGDTAKPIKIPPTYSNSVPGLNYSFPEGSFPFGVFVKGGGIQSVKSTQYVNDVLVPKGYKVAFDSRIGVKYYNFMNLIDSNEPLNKELTILDARFSAITGLGTGPSYNNEPNGIILSLNILEGLFSDQLTFEPKTPGAPVIPLEYTISQEMNIDLVNIRFFIGPVPVKIAANVGGNAGLELYGQANTQTIEFNGSIKPYFNTTFNASGGVDAVIAYATLNAGVNPLLGVGLPLGFSSANDGSLSFNGSLNGLTGKIYLSVGFYYPCPDLEKVVGFLTGDEDLPLCECRWDYNIFDFPGFSHDIKY